MTHKTIPFAPVSAQGSPVVSVSGGLGGATLAATPAALLVVDDDENLLRMLRRGLAFAGYTVRIAADGDTALDVVGSGAIAEKLDGKAVDWMEQVADDQYRA